MKKLLFALLLLPLPTLADVIPAGCYVADYYRTDPCWSSSTGFYFWNWGPSNDSQDFYYGYAVSAILGAGSDKVAALNSCNISIADLGNRFNALAAQQGATESNRQEWIVYGNNQAAAVKKANALITKLRKACGSKCKKIK